MPLQLTTMGVGRVIGAGLSLGACNAVRVSGPGGVVLTFALRAIGSYGEKGFGVAIARPMPLGGLLGTIAGVFASTSAPNATTYSAMRPRCALGRDRMMPEAFGRLSARLRPPHV